MRGQGEQLLDSGVPSEQRTGSGARKRQTRLGDDGVGRGRFSANAECMRHAGYIKACSSALAGSCLFTRGELDRDSGSVLGSRRPGMRAQGDDWGVGEAVALQSGHVG